MKLKKVENKIKELINRAHDNIDLDVLLKWGLTEKELIKYEKLKQTQYNLQEQKVTNRRK